jgi:putative ABC transport system permease protein
MFLVLLGGAGIVLLIACANVANLLLARLLKVERDLATRAALGASKMRLVQQVLTESVLVSLSGGLLGLALAPVALAVLVKFAESFTPRVAEVRIDAPILFFTLLISVMTGVVFGLAPALSSRGWGGNAFNQAGSRSTTSRGRHRLRSALVVAQVAVSVILLAGAGLMIRSFAKLQQVRPGFSPDRLLTMRLSPGFPPYTIQTIKPFADRLLARIRTTTGVESAALASNFPFNPRAVVSGPGANLYEIEGEPFSKTEAAPTIDVTIVGANYFETIRQPIVKGRSFTERDETTGQAVAIINETMARHHFRNENPIGKRLRFDQGIEWTPWVEIVGVAGDVKEYGLERPVTDEVYGVFRNGFVGRLIARTTLDPDRMAPVMRAAIHDVDPLVAVGDVETVERAEYDSMASPRLMSLLLGIFAGLAVVISCSGIAAVMALAVSQRTHEIGIRMALGAGGGSVVSMVLRQGIVLALAGTALGMAGAAALTRLLATFLYGTSPTDLATFFAVSLLFLLVAAVACFIPAHQVTSIDPLVALRQE